MNKTEFTKKVAEKAGIEVKAADASVKAAIAVIEEALRNGEKVKITGFGTFDVRKRPARKGKNPRTGEEIKIKASKSPVFKAGQALKNEANKRATKKK